MAHPKGVLAALCLGILAASCPCADLPVSGAAKRTYTYRARGDVRLLLFWVGRDAVGGGRISLSRDPPDASTTWCDEVELVFGSDPERVPGQINRWGYAQERACWQPGPDGQPDLVRTVFTGLMRHSDDRAPSRLLTDDRRQTAAHRYQYKAIHCEAARDGASAEIRVFEDSNQFHYRNPDPLLLRYRETIAPDQPQTSWQLVNAPARYRRPFGMLSGLSALIGETLAAHDRNQRALPVARSLLFVHGAALYRLDVESVAYRKAWPGRPELGEVADISFQTLSLAQNRKTRFSISVPVRGGLRGVPVRIVYQPHWWLRIRLDLAAAGAGLPAR